MTRLSNHELSIIIRSTKNPIISNYEFEEVITIDFTIPSPLRFEDCVFHQELEFSSSAKAHEPIDFVNCKFEQGVTFRGGVYEHIVAFLECEVLTNVVHFIGGEFKDDLEFRGGAFKKILFSTGQFTNVLIGSTKRNIFISELFIHNSYAKGSFHFHRASIYEFVCTGIISTTSILSFTHSVVHHFAGYDLTNRGKFRISQLSTYFEPKRFDSIEENEWWFGLVKKMKVNPRSIFLLENVVLEKAEIFSIDFRQYDIISIRESSLIDIILSNTVWPENINHFPREIVHDPVFNQAKEVRSVENSRLTRETYRQLKFASGKQGDVTQEQYFHGLEMTAYEKCLSWKNDFWTKLIIRLSYLTSNYGQSILQPLVWLLGGHLVFFLIATSANGIEVNSFEQAFEKYFTYINPLHKLDDFLKGYLTIVDVLMRIWSSYMLYNIVRASRRFIK